MTLGCTCIRRRYIGKLHYTHESCKAREGMLQHYRFLRRVFPPSEHRDYGRFEGIGGVPYEACKYLAVLRIQLDDELGTDAKVRSTSANCPEEVWILCSAGSQYTSVGDDNSCLGGSCSSSK